MIVGSSAYKAGGDGLDFESVDVLQRTLADSVFSYTSDRKKAAGRALGTLVELVTYNALVMWNLRDHMLIERRIPEYGNPSITHNVEFSLHPILSQQQLRVEPLDLPLTTSKITKATPFLRTFIPRATQILTRDGLKRNAAILSDEGSSVVSASVDELYSTSCLLTVSEVSPQPFALVECKRVGIEEGMKKGPQTIEKAKQGAYVARSVSSLQRVRLADGSIQGILEQPTGAFRSGPYADVLRSIISESASGLPSGFVLTIGIVSNHGNWFSSGNLNKELLVLAQSYDWLLFLTDDGLAQFIDNMLLRPRGELTPARDAFLASYSASKTKNRFTKVNIDVEADKSLLDYFASNRSDIESWFNVVSPNGSTITDLRRDLEQLANRTS